MKKYLKPTLTVVNYKLDNINICKVSNVVDVERPDWGVNGIQNAFK